MVKTYEGNVQAHGKKFAIVVSRFNEFITSRLKDGAIDCLIRHGAAENDIDVILCPGCFEIPLVCQQAVGAKAYDAVLALGAVIRGDTPHFDYVAGEVAKGVAQVMLQSGVPVIFGVITTDTLEQAIERAGSKGGNKGSDAAASAIEMTNLKDSLK